MRDSLHLWNWRVLWQSAKASFPAVKCTCFLIVRGYVTLLLCEAQALWRPNLGNKVVFLSRNGGSYYIWLFNSLWVWLVFKKVEENVIKEIVLFKILKFSVFLVLRTCGPTLCLKGDLVIYASFLVMYTALNYKLNFSGLFCSCSQSITNLRNERSLLVFPRLFGYQKWQDFDGVTS